MALFALRRLVLAIPLLIGITFISFMVIQLAPGGPFDYLRGEESGQDSKLIERLNKAINATLKEPEVRERLLTLGFTAAGGTPELRVRIGMAAGEPVDRNDDLFGSTVTLAARICDAADAGHILVSDVVHDLGVERGFPLHETDERVLKGFSGPTRLFELLRTPG